jgi:hopanoid biosynthesis associated protein HpnK
MRSEKTRIDACRAKRLIVTADDFGLSVPVNEAVERAHREGVLSAASLMVGAPAADDAVARARKIPSLGVGLHLTLLDGCPVLPPDRISGLIGSDGRFFNDPIRFGVALYLSRGLQRQANAEVEAQFARFAATGLKLDHVNGHRHFHMHPVVLRSVLEFAPRFGRPPVRIPFEPFMPSFKASGNRAFGRLLSSLFYFAQTQRMRRSLREAQVPSNDRVFGLNDSGALTETLFLGLIDQLPGGVSEIYCHPATRRWEGTDTIPARYRPESELAALLSPAVKRAIEDRGLRSLSYRAALASADEDHQTE